MGCRLCDANTILIKGLCQKCLDNTYSTFNKSKLPRAIYIKECLIHGKYLALANKENCKKCFSKTIRCGTCEKEILNININDNNIHYCSNKCQRESVYKNHMGPGKCIICRKFYEKRNIIGKCEKCMSVQQTNNVVLNKKSGNCSICGIFNKERDQNARGIDCGCSQKWFNKHNFSEQMKKQAKDLLSNPEFHIKRWENEDLKTRTVIRMKNLWNNEDYRKNQIKIRKENSHFGVHFEYCNVCDRETIHNGYNCCVCKPKSKSCVDASPFITVEKGFCKDHNKETLKFYKYDKYICWSCFKEMFHNKDNENEFIGNILLLFQDAFVQNTFRTQDSVNWSGARAAFEQNLVDHNINYFIYIKFYIDLNNNTKPLVVGKSGSTLVNYNGSDVCFSTYEDHGPARKFLLEEDFKWCKTQILIIPMYSEKEALKAELKFKEKYYLFSS